MATTALVPKSWYSWDFELTSADRTVARFDMSSWCDRLEIIIDGVKHQVYRASMLGDFVIERGGQIQARAAKPSAFSSTMILTHGGRDYALQKRSVWKRAFVLLDGEREIGSVAPVSSWTRHATVELPAEWPIAVQAFVISLVIVLWRREAASAAA
jgi:hypothetical protein